MTITYISSSLFMGWEERTLSYFVIMERERAETENMYSAVIGTKNKVVNYKEITAKFRLRATGSARYVWLLTLFHLQKHRTLTVVFVIAVILLKFN
jgi:hypothetical protein